MDRQTRPVHAVGCDSAPRRSEALTQAAVWTGVGNTRPKAPGPKAGWRLGAGQGAVAASGTRFPWGARGLFGDQTTVVAARHHERAESHCLTHSEAVNCESSKCNCDQE